jgi:hypothetical protein
VKVLAGFLLLAAAAGGLLFLLRRDDAATRTSAPEAAPAASATSATPAASATSTDAPPPGTAGPGKVVLPATPDPSRPTGPTPSPAPGSLPRPEAPARDPGRERAVQARIEEILADKLADYPDLVKISDIACSGEGCRVELLVDDLKLFTPAYERMQEPGGGFADEGGTMVLEQPRPTGPNGRGPYRVAFRLLPGDAGPAGPR